MASELRAAAGARLLLRVTGAGLLIASAAMHLDLYLTGYRTIPTIGVLFLLQVIVGFAAALAVLVTGNRLVAAFGALFALSTLGGYLLTVQFGLFGFREVRTTAGIVAAVLEVAAFVVLAVFAATPTAGRSPVSAASTGSSGQSGLAALAGRARDGVGSGTAGLAAAAVAVVAFALLGGALAGAASGPSAGGPAAAGPAGGGGQASPAATGGGLRTADIAGTRVLTNGQGRTLYWFAPDTSTKSVCNGSCAAYWPPVTGPLTAAPDIPGQLGTISRADGSTQATYNGHPLYTYIGDSGPGQANGNNLNLNGGLWHEVVVSSPS